ncbi:MAG TPA: alpha/beta hydrolase [Geodermatophilus sp.]|nr:alpha/beta hydrolase [Geodermatophilus sp.]
MTASLLLVHGAWHGPWAWRPLLDHLDGLDVHTVDLPSSGTDPAALGDLRADAEVVRAALAGIDGPAVVVGHSYGGVVVSEAATPDTGAAHLVYLCAFQLDVGESLLAAVGGQAPPWWEVHDGHVVATGPEEVFYNGCPPDLTSAAVGRLGLQSRAAFEQPLSRAAWREVPSTYVVCEADQAIPLFAQEQMAGRAGDVVRLPDGHSPFLSSPGEVARVLRDVAVRAG